MSRGSVNLLLILVLLGLGCAARQEGEPPRRDERPTADPTLPLPDLAFLRASREVQQAKLSMASPDEAFRLYTLYDREFDSTWRMTEYLAEHRPDMVPMLQAVLLNPTSTIRHLTCALALVTWMHGAGTYDVVRDEDLMVAILSAEERVVARTHLPRQWSEGLADIERARLKE